MNRYGTYSRHGRWQNRPSPRLSKKCVLYFRSVSAVFSTPCVDNAFYWWIDGPTRTDLFSCKVNV